MFHGPLRHSSKVRQLLSPIAVTNSPKARSSLAVHSVRVTRQRKPSGTGMAALSETSAPLTTGAISAAGTERVSADAPPAAHARNIAATPLRTPQRAIAKPPL